MIKKQRDHESVYEINTQRSSKVIIRMFGCSDEEKPEINEVSC